ncbi:MAG TPA: hypothetical protein GYA07_11015 [Verrucomicrobia bacterium]|nr:hypothetical protein [Verrucomicrobiota bacterium]HOB31848.1 hypothetical protein [Verrucomicrobiota bacterium]HOP97627.1 hypothetical protein [Verrucomicrobiota bacterium]
MKITKKKVNYIGKKATVRSCFGGYSLPDGLPEGATVEIVGFDIGCFDVRFGRKTFRVPMACVENLHLLWR